MINVFHQCKTLKHHNDPNIRPLVSEESIRQHSSSRWMRSHLVKTGRAYSTHTHCGSWRFRKLHSPTCCCFCCCRPLGDTKLLSLSASVSVKPLHMLCHGDLGVKLSKKKKATVPPSTPPPQKAPFSHPRDLPLPPNQHRPPQTSQHKALRANPAQKS